MRTILCAGVAFAAISIPTTVDAQSETEADGSEESVSIVVTARKRDEELIDVPASVTALGNEQIRQLVLDGVEDYIRQIPSATLVNAGPEYLNDISLRGQGGGRIGFSETATGLYRNGLYIAGGGFGGRSLSRLDLYDVERVEVLRGPQGALYGRNSIGGAINVITQRPVHDWEGEASFAYWDIDRIVADATLNIPVDDNLAARFGGFYYDQWGGNITNTVTGNTVDQREYYGGRAQLLFEPDSSARGNFILEYYNATAPGFANLGYRATGTDGAVLDPSPFERVLSAETPTRIEQLTAAFQFEADLGEGTLHAGVRHSTRDGERLDGDFDHFIGFQGRVFGGTAVELFASQTEDFDQYGGEIYYASGDGGPFTWLLGGEFQTFTSDVSTVIDGTAPVPGLRRLLREDTTRDELSSLAVFGAFDWEVSESVSIGVEARVQSDSKTFNFDRSRSQADSLSTPISASFSERWTEFIPTATIQFRPADNHRLYIRAARGYRPGGFNQGVPGDIPGAEALIPYDPETATSAEIGWKGEFFGGALRTDLSLYYTATDDVQAVTQASDTVTQFILQNAGDSDIYGVEFELSGRFQLGPGRLRLTAGFSANDGEFADGTSVILGGVATDVAGNRVNRTRDYVINASVNYSVPLSDSVELFSSTSMQTEGGGYENISNTRELDNFFLVDVRAGFRSDNWQLSVFGRNIFDEMYTLQTVSSNVYFNEPRVWGIQGRFNF